MSHHVIVVGAGIAGLACARNLERRGIQVTVLESDSRVGGRVRTDNVEGFLLDRGFQVLLTGYPESRAALDLGALDLRPFRPGVKIWRDGRFHHLGDPSRRPGDVFATLAAPFASLSDIRRLWSLRRRLLRSPLDELLKRPEQSTRTLLDEVGFSTGFVEAFLQPFFSGVFLESSLATSSRFFEFVFRSFAIGDASLPNRGMASVPAQLAADLRSIRLGVRVASVSPKSVALADGSSLDADATVVAAGPRASAALLGDSEPSMNGTVCLYYAASEPPYRAPWLTVNGDRGGLVNLWFPAEQIAPGYAPSGRSLISVTLREPSDLPDAELDVAVRRELSAPHGSATDGWRLLRVDRITGALPRQVPPALEPISRSVRRADGIFVAGDHLEMASLSGALRSGRLAARAVAESLA